MEDELGADEVLTQYGNRSYPPGEPFRRKPREGKETKVSLLRGRLSVDEAAKTVNHRREASGAYTDDGVRYVTVRALSEAGFSAEATPSRLIKAHVSIGLAGEGDWTEDISASFDACFTEATWKEESQ